MRRSREDAQKTKQSIIDVAKELFCKNGYDRTNLCDIADAAGVTRGAVYWHFQNKDELFIEIWRSMVEHSTYEQFIKLHITHDEHIQHNKVLDSFRDWLALLASNLTSEESTSFFKVCCAIIQGQQGSNRIRSQVQVFNEEFSNSCIKFVQEAVLSHELPMNLDIPLATSFILAILDGYVHHCVFENKSDFVKQHELIADTIIKQLGNFTRDNPCYNHEL